MKQAILIAKVVAPNEPYIALLIHAALSNSAPNVVKDIAVIAIYMKNTDAKNKVPANVNHCFLFILNIKYHTYIKLSPRKIASPHDDSTPSKHLKRPNIINCYNYYLNLPLESKRKQAARPRLQKWMKKKTC